MCINDLVGWRLSFFLFHSNRAGKCLWLFNYIIRPGKPSIHSVDSSFSTCLRSPQVHINPVYRLYTSLYRFLPSSRVTAWLLLLFFAARFLFPHVFLWLYIAVTRPERDWQLGAYFTCHRFINKDSFKRFSCYTCVITNIVFLSLCLFFFFSTANPYSRRWTAFWWVFLIFQMINCFLMMLNI